MLAVSALRSTNDEREGQMEGFSIGGNDDFPEFSGGNLLDSIDFDDLFVGFSDGDVLPDLEMDPEILAEFSASGGEESEMNTSSAEKADDNSRKEEEDKVSGSGSGSSLNQGEEIVSKTGESVGVNPSKKESDKGRKSSAQSKNPQGKRKVKVDWTPELHRRFVQAVEQLGVDKAVPSRILELMGIDCLTRHNIASHLQVEKLKDLCLKQREEIKALKNAVLFPDAMNSQFQELWEKQVSELKQAKQLIPSLHRQVTSLTGQLQCLAKDLAEVKADKYSARRCYDNLVSSPRTLAYDQEDTPNSLEFSSGDHTTLGSPDDIFVNDINPCLTPYYANTKSKEFEALGCDSPPDERFSRNNMQLRHEIGFDFRVRKMSKSSDCCQCSNSSGSTSARPARRSGESKCTYGKQMNHKFL